MNEVLIEARNQDEKNTVKSRFDYAQDVIRTHFGAAPEINAIRICRQEPGFIGFLRRAIDTLDPDITLSESIDILKKPELKNLGQWMSNSKQIIIYEGDPSKLRTYDRFTIAHELGHAVLEQIGGCRKAPLVVKEAFADMVGMIVTNAGNIPRDFLTSLDKSKGTLFDGHLTDKVDHFGNIGRFKDAAILYYIKEVYGLDKLWEIVGHIKEASQNGLLNFFLDIYIGPQKVEEARISQLEKFEKFLIQEIGIVNLKELTANALDWYKERIKV